MHLRRKELVYAGEGVDGVLIGCVYLLEMRNLGLSSQNRSR